MKIFKRFFLLLYVFVCSLAAGAQNNITISGNVFNKATKESLDVVSVTITGGTAGTYTDEKGRFKLNTSQKPPFTLMISSVGYADKEIEVTSETQNINIELEPSYILGTEIVIAASRMPERLLQSPVSIERVNTLNIINAPAPSYYDLLNNLKGVDFTTSSLTFKTPSTRGFNGSGNVRFNQIVDGMDNQAPGLNFSLGNVIGLTQLDVDNMELLEGASSALYGPGGMNGTLIVTSKDPFKYQGISAEVKMGAMNINSPVRSASPYYDLSVRWAQKLSDKFAFKLSAQYIEAKDWVAYDSSDYDLPNTMYKTGGGTRETDPAYNGVNLYGDEHISQIPDMLTLSQEILGGATQQYVSYYESLSGGVPPTQQQINAFLNSSASGVQPFYVGVANGIIPKQYVTRTGYREADIIDPTTKNIKFSGGLFYKINDRLTASFIGYYGTGNTVYTGSDRYSLKNLQMGQYKLELKSTNWFLRGYTTQENAGDAFNATVNTELLNEAWKPSVNINNLAGSWYPQYIAAFVGAKLAGANDVVAYNAARTFADAGRPAPGSAQFNNIFDSIAKIPIPNGGRFLDKSDLYMVEGQYNFTNALGLKNKGTDVLAGANWKEYILNSEGTLFADYGGKIHINEYGAYAQISQKILKDVLKLSVSGRYDKNENFDGHFTPRATAVITVAKNQNIRLSYQSAYRFPTTQNQWINLRVGGNAYLIGGLPALRDLHHFNTNPAYTQASFQQFVATGNPSVLQIQQFGKYSPEIANSYEIGYKGLAADNKLLIDVYGYYAQYKNLLTRINTFQSSDSSGNPQGLKSPTIISVSVNSPNKVHTNGYGASLQYLLRNNFSISGNFFSDEIHDVPAGYKAYFNTPKYRANIGFANSGFGFEKRFGFNIIWRWQDAFYEESDFIQGNVKAFSTLDAQVSYKFPTIKSLIKLGATNITNHYYINAPGNPSIGGLYYVSLGYNVF
ncbi:MAG: TonB-dependent receptor domain-containing protein [Chitinophagaceae bacterium]